MKCKIIDLTYCLFIVKIVSIKLLIIFLNKSIITEVKIGGEKRNER